MLRTASAMARDRRVFGDAAVGAMGGRGFDERYGVIQLIETVKPLPL